MSVNRSSFRVPAPNVVVFDIRSPDGSIAVSEQDKPTSGKLNIDDFIRINVLNSVEYLSPLGQATIGNLADGTRFGTLVTNGWIIVTGPQQVTSNDVRGVINAMNPVSSS
jgi:hypothetical protein